MRFVSLFSGIEAASVAWGPLGWEAMAFAEIEPFPCSVLAHRFPDVPNLGDVTRIDWKEFETEYGKPDIVCGGSPCQSFSIAGGRESLSGESRLMFEFIRCLDDLRPRWFLWENVPGVLNTRDDAFAQLLGEVQRLGYFSLAWRVLDAQFFGVAQRRRRVFLVGHIGTGGGAAAVLFEPESLRGNTKSSREKREELARASDERAAIGFKCHQSDGGLGIERKQAKTLDVASQPPVVCMQDGQANGGIGENVSTTLNASHEQPIVCMSSDTSNAAVDEDVAGTLHVGGAAADCIGPLCARDYKGVGNQYVQEGKVICQRRF